MADVKTVRLVNAESGCVVVVDEETAGRLGPGWGTEKPTKRAVEPAPAKSTKK